MRRHAFLQGFLTAAAVAATAGALCPAPASAAEQETDSGLETRVPQTALSLCPALQVVSRETVTPGTAMAVSPDGRFRLTYVHTLRGAQFTLLDRDSRAARRFDKAAPPLPPGITWRVFEASFSPDSRWLAIGSVGVIWVFDTSNAQALFSIAADVEEQIYPGKMSWSRNRLAVVFWPAESFLADAVVKKPVEARLYDAGTGVVTRRFQLALESSNAWTELRISPDASRLAVLERARKWPGKARLILFSTENGNALWERKISAEDLAWTGDGRQLLLLGSKLVWLGAESGKEAGRAATNVPHSEFQKLRVNEAAQAALGRFAQYSLLKRALEGTKKREWLVLLWQLDTKQPLCEVPLQAATSIDPWLTARGEILALEETYDVRPPLRLLKSAHILLYRIVRPVKQEEPAKPTERRH